MGSFLHFHDSNCPLKSVKRVKIISLRNRDVRNEHGKFGIKCLHSLFHFKTGVAPFKNIV